MSSKGTLEQLRISMPSSSYGMSAVGKSGVDVVSTPAKILCISFCSGACASSCESQCATACSTNCGSQCATACTTSCQSSCSSSCWSLCSGGGSADIVEISSVEEIVL